MSLLHDPYYMYYLFAALVTFPVIRILKRAGFPLFWAGLLAVPMIGFACCAGVLALRKWRV
jgi:hypothetical protein